MIRCLRRLSVCLWCVLLFASVVNAETDFGPYHARFLAGGEGIADSIDTGAAVLNPDASWTLQTWVRSLGAQSGPVLLGGFGDPEAADGRYLGLRDGRAFLKIAEG